MSPNGPRLFAPEQQSAVATSEEPMVIDLCCGLGGLSLAATRIGMHVVAGVDINHSALRTFRRNFPGATAIEGSVRSSKVLEQCEMALKARRGRNDSMTVAVSGPPCQGFSAAGTRDPKDLRNKVLVAVARSIVRLQPCCAVVENVSMLLSQRYRNRVRSFEETLSVGGYRVTDIILEASDFGVAQKRRRTFFLITRQKLQKDEVNARLAQFKTPAVTVQQALAGLSTPTVRPDDYDDDKDYGAICNHFAMRHSERVIDKIKRIAPGKGPMSYRRLHPTKLSNTLFSGHRAPPAHFAEPRSITVREAARLQGFPDTFRIFGSFANQMEQVTNAVPPPLAQAVLAVLHQYAKEARR